ncbi:MAG: hypothetical protein ACRDDY_03460 [Clostridium sp.]|uniref:hypothetical protein n=1 Tax=Clostridium sp. TaxID=1506 RepID=UPI003EE798FD
MVIWTKRFVESKNPHCEWLHEYKYNKMILKIMKLKKIEKYCYWLEIEMPNGQVMYNSVNKIFFDDKKYIDEIKRFYEVNV